MTVHEMSDLAKRGNFPSFYSQVSQGAEIRNCNYYYYYYYQEFGLIICQSGIRIIFIICPKISGPPTHLYFLSKSYPLDSRQSTLENKIE